MPEIDDAGDNRPLTFELKLTPHPYILERGIRPATAAEFGLGYCTRGVIAGRIAIPIRNRSGELVAYAGRWPGDDVPANEEKYMLPPRFKKMHELYGAERVHGVEELVIVEGYFSVMRLFELGIPAVALMGRTLSERQEALLVGLGARRLVLLFDGDEPGRTAAAEILPRLARRFYVRIVSLPDGQQPDTVSETELREVLSYVL